MALEDKQMRRRAEREMAKFPLDLTKMMVRCAGDTIYLEGRVRLVRGGEGKTADLDKILRAAEETLRSIHKIRDVITAGLVKDYG